MLYTTDLEGTIHFYVNLLGFTCNEVNFDWGWASLEKDGIELMFSKPNEHIPFTQSHFTGSFYFKTNDVVSIWNQLRDTVQLAYPLEHFEYGMHEFALLDNNGYLIQFGQETDDK